MESEAPGNTWRRPVELTVKGGTMTWLGLLALGFGAFAVINRFLGRRYREMYGSAEPEFRDPPVAPDLGWPGGR